MEELIKRVEVLEKEVAELKEQAQPEIISDKLANVVIKALKKNTIL